MSAPLHIAVILAMNDEANRKKLAGIFDYLRGQSPSVRGQSPSLWGQSPSFSHPRWDIQLSESFPQNIQDLQHIDGLICGSPPPQSMGTVPTIVLHLPDEAVRPSVCYVTCDNASVGEIARKHLKNSGFNSFAYVNDKGLSPWSRERAKAFSQGLSPLPQGPLPQGLSPSNTRGLSLRERFRSWPETGFDDLGDWLRDLPQRTALLAADDVVAREVLLKCAALGIRVPNDLAILGVDNDELLCESCSPPLTSVEPDFRRAGYLAAHRLDMLLRQPSSGSQQMPTVEHYGVKRVVERESARFVERHEDPRITAALSFIREHAASPIGVTDVTTHLKIARRTAELLFRQKTKHSIGELIRLARLDAMMHRLRTTDSSIEEICATSGFSSESHAKRAFKLRFGRPMSAFRA